MLVTASPAFAQGELTDEVVLRASTGRSRIVVKCDVLEFTGKKLVARLGANNNDATYPAEDVIEVRTPHLPAHAEGLKALAAGDTDRAETLFEKALVQEPRTWVRRDLLALLVRCALRRADFSSAGVRFIRLYQSDPDTQHIELIPLAWSNRPVPAETRAGAIAWLRDNQPIARLIGASLLLLEPQHVAEAEKTLQELATQPLERIRLLAQWQLWRRKTAIGPVSDYDVERWENRIEELDAVLKAGPYFVLAEGFAVRREFDLAAATYLRLPLAYPTDHPITVEAFLRAGQALTRAGMLEEAARTYRELVEKYAHTSFAAEAQQSLQRLPESNQN